MTATDATVEVEGRPSSGAVLASQIKEAAQGRARRKDLRPLARLAPYLLAHPVQVWLAALFMLVAMVSTLAMPVAVRFIIDRGFGSHAAAEMNRWFGILVTIALVSAVATALRYYFVTRLGERAVADLRQALFGHVLTLDPAFFLEMRLGEVLSRMTTDIAIVETLATTSISVAVRNILAVIGAVIMMAITSPKLTGWVLLVIPLVLVPLFVFGRQVRKVTTLTQDRFAGAVGMAGESLDALETVQAFGREQSASARFSEAVDLVFKTSLRRMGIRAGMTATFITLIYGGIAAVLWLSAQEVAVHHSMSSGTLIQFFILSVFAASSFAALGETYGEVQKAAGAMERIDELMRAEPTIKAPPDPIALPSPAIGEAAFKNVVFAYPGRPDLPALNGFSMTVKPGETVALVGPSGAGKTTVFRLLLRFYDPQSGTVALDGVDLKAADPKAVRARTALVAQDAALFSGSALDNIRFGREDASPDDAREAASEAQALGFIEALPQGFDSPLGERARSLSGGQRQRLAIARALVREAPILLLDEATSALDAENERLVQRALDKAMEGRTTLVIAHRLATVLRADRIVVMDAGKVVEEGTHAELVARGGLYARLADLQFQTT